MRETNHQSFSYQPDEQLPPGYRTEARVSLSDFLEGANAAVGEALKILTDFQLGRRGPLETKFKRDKTLVTAADLEVAKAIRSHLSSRFPDLDAHIEDARGTTVGKPYRLLVDPLDGTAPFILGAPTSTVIIGLYSCLEKDLKGVSIGDVAFGRRWFAQEGGGAHVLTTSPGSAHNIVTECQVWDGRLDSSSQVFADFYPGFRRPNRSNPNQMRDIFTPEQYKRLNAELFEICRPSLLGSNGMHHALVANGGQGAAGAITTAIGGEWDVAGVRLVLEAGGVAAAYCVGDDGSLQEVSALDPYAQDIAIVANNFETLEVLKDLVERAKQIG